VSPPRARLLTPLADETYRRLFAAQVVALVGTGVSTVALGLLAYELSRGNAGAVLGAAFALKMVAYVVLAPVMAALADRVPRRRLLVGLDSARAGVVLFLPFVTEIWQVLLLVFVLNACSAGFTPAFQATIPDVLPDEERYTAALSLSRLAYDLQELLSPVLAAVLLLVVGFSELFVLNAAAFGVSALLVLTTALPRVPRRIAPEASLASRATAGIRSYLATPRLRGLLALSLAAAAGSAMVIVNTVVLVQDRFALGGPAVAVALAAAGAGSMTAPWWSPASARCRSFPASRCCC
jgi:MFS family permease